MWRLNARVADKVDIILKDNDPFLPLPNDNIYEFILPRVSSGKSVINQSGNWLIDLCIDNQLYLLNGRTLGDLTGKFTCHTPRGSSIVGYIITSSSLSTLVQSMNISDITLFSDDCILTVKLKVFSDFSYESSDRVETEMHSLNVPDVFSWSRTSKTKYEEALRSSEVKLKIEKLDEIVDTSSVNVQKLISH